MSSDQIQYIYEQVNFQTCVWFSSFLNTQDLEHGYPTEMCTHLQQIKTLTSQLLKTSIWARLLCWKLDFNILSQGHLRTIKLCH